MTALVQQFGWLTIPCVALLLVTAPETTAQQRGGPHIGYVYPAGGQAGTTFDVTVGGQNLNGTTNAYVSGLGIQAVVPPYEPMITGREAKDLRERLQELRKKEKDPDVFKEIMTIRKKLAAFDKKRLTPALADTMIVRVAIASNAPPGNRELRLATYNGLSNPLMFQVGQLTEFREPEQKAENLTALVEQLKNARAGRQTPVGTNTTETVITVPATINGQILPGEVDRYRFKGRPGQQLVVDVSARELIPYLADAVPGWFQAKVVLYDSQGKELAYDDHYRFHPDPVIFYTIPKDGEYVLEIRDSIYRGREDFVYRVAIGELPFVTNVYPLGARTGTQPTVAITGVNLPFNKLPLNLKDAEPGMYPFSVRNKGITSNRMPFMLDTLPECLKISPSNSPTNAQQLTLPVIVNGHINQPGDVDVFRFSGHAGEQIVAEVFARRLDSPLDSVLKLTDTAGRQIAFNDDFEDKGSGLNTHHADSYLTATLPANGTYYLYLWDAQQKGGWAYSYRLRLSEPRPDFELRVVPSSITSRPGGSFPVSVFALRRDGFTNDIAIALKDAPEGFKLSSGSLVGTQEQVKVTLTLPSKPPKEPFNLTLEGRAKVQGHEIAHPAVPADDMMQAFAYRHLVPAKELKVVFATGAPPRPPESKTATKEPAKPSPVVYVRIRAGSSAKLQLKLPTNNYGKLQLELEEPPEGISIKSFATNRDGVEVVLQTDATKIKPGRDGDLTIRAYSERTNTKPQSEKQRTAIGSIGPIRFEIVAHTTPQK